MTNTADNPNDRATQGEQFSIGQRDALFIRFTSLKGIPPAAKVVLGVLLTYANRGTRLAIRDLMTISRDSGSSYTMVCEYIPLLEQAGVIRKRSGRSDRHTNRYLINLEWTAPPPGFMATMPRSNVRPAERLADRFGRGGNITNVRPTDRSNVRPTEHVPGSDRAGKADRPSPVSESTDGLYPGTEAARPRTRSRPGTASTETGESPPAAFNGTHSAAPQSPAMTADAAARPRQLDLWAST